MAEKSETLVTKEERLNEAKELFGRGSRNYCMKQFTEAADDLSSCCAIYSELYGPRADECGLAYLLYAKSLIAVGKDENNLIAPADDEEEEADEDADEEEEGEGEGEEDGEDADGGAGEDANEEQEDGVKDVDMETNEAQKKDTSKDEEPKEGTSEGAAADGEKATGAKKESKEAGTEEEPQPGPSTSNGGMTEQEETDDGAGNLQVAWEILELAVKIFEAQGEQAYENLAECYSELAGISFENSHFQEAINDYTKAMETSKKTNKSDLRMLAEIHYKVGLCHLMVNDYGASIASFQGAIGELEKVIEGEKAKEQTDETKEVIDELEETKKDIMEKIADVEEAKKTSIEEVKRELSKIIVSGGGESSSNGVNNGAGTSSSSASSSSAATGATNGSGAKSSDAPAKPVTDISHLIKRKKPDSASAEVEGSPAKKPASDADNVNTSA